MGRRRKGKRADLEAVALGRVSVGVGELMRLIHEVNPTGREVGSEEAARRYRTKAALQSRLVLEFGEQIVVRADDPEAAVVSLWHRSGTLDACHAVVAELDDEARSWVRRRLDEAAVAEPGVMPSRPAEPEPAGPPAGRSEASSPAELRAQARAAVAEYDYEAARLLLLKALDQQPGAVETARALLDLLVDQLGADQDALALETRLGPPASDDAEVRVRLALAAARLAQADRARHLLRGVRGPRAAEAHAALAQAAIQAGDDGAAGHWIGELQASAPDAPELLPLAEAREALRARQRAPLEAEMEEARRAGREEEAERRAHEILARWPESRAASHLVHQIGSRQRLEERAQRLLAATEALTEGDVAEARALYREAEAIGGRDPALWARIEQALAEEQARADRERLVRLQRQLTGESRRQALLEYLSLPDEQRAALRERSGAAALSWLEEAGVSGTGARARGAVDAVLALETAQALLADGRAEEATAHLAAHEKGLRGIREAQALRERAGELSAARRRAEAEAMVEAAALAIGRGEVEEGQRLLSACDVKLLPEEAQRRARDLSERTARAAETRLLERRLQEALHSEDLLLARDLAGELAELGSGDERTRWLEERDRLRSAIRRKWRVRLLAGGRPVRFPPAVASVPSWGEPAVWLTADGSSVVVCCVVDSWLLVQLVAVDSARLLGGAMLRAPASFGEEAGHLVEGDRVWIYGSSGQLLCLSMPDWEVVSFRSLAELLPPGLVIHRIHPFPRADRVWVVTHQIEDDPGPTVVVDLSAGRTSRTLPPSIEPVLPIRGADPPQLLWGRDERPGGTLYTVTGSPRELVFAGQPEQATLHPDGEGLLALVGISPKSGREEDELLGVVELERRDSPGKPLILWDGRPTFAQTIATALDDGRAFALVTGDGAQRMLVALEPTARGLRTAYRVPVPRETMLVQDSGSRRVRLLLGTPDGVELHPPGPVGPRTGPSLRFGLRHDLPMMEGWFPCGQSPAASRFRLVASLRSRAAARRGEPDPGPPADDGPFGPDAVAQLRRLLAEIAPHRGGEAETSRLLDELVTEPAGEPDVELARVELLAGVRSWDRARARIEAQDLSRFNQQARKHLLHLLVLARLWLGDVARARDALEEAGALDGTCGLDGCRQLLAALPSALGPAHWGEDQPLVRRLRACVTAADAALLRGDLEAAIRILDQPLVWAAQEVQSLARLAEAYLRVDDDRASVDTALVVATFRRADSSPPLFRRELPFPGATWDRPRLDDLARRCLEYLEAPQDG